MCLRTTQRRADTAKNKIVCYKVARLLDEKPTFVSMFMNFRYKSGGMPRREKNFRCISRNSAVYHGFHSYTAMRHAYRMANWYDVILKCEIPPGSRYYTSADGCEYCSNRIKVIAWRRKDKRKWQL